MRTLFGLAAVLSLAALPTPSEACGYGIISVFRIASHRALEGGWRSFAVVANADVAPAKWRTLSEGSYEMPLEVAARAGKDARKLTLVGPSGTRVATEETNVELKGPETKGFWMHAVGLGDRHEFQFAVSGPAIGLKQEPFALERASDEDASWMTAHDLAVTDGVYVARAGDLEILSTGEVTAVRRKGELVAQAKGLAVGLLGSDGTHYLLVENERTIKPIMLWD